MRTSIGILVLVILVAACRDNDPVSDIMNGQQTGVEFVMAVDTLNYDIFVNDEFVGTLRRSGDTISRDLPPGTHKFHVRDNVTTLLSESESLVLFEGQRRIVTLGSGSMTLTWTSTIDFSALYADVTTTGQPWISTRFWYEGNTFGGRSVAVGWYWMQQRSGGYVFVQSGSCNFDTPQNVIGHVRIDSLIDNDGFVVENITGTQSIPATCFPDRSAGATYYATARIYQDSFLNSPNDPFLARIGPPETIARIRFNASGQPVALD